MLATEVHRRLISDCNGRDPRSGAAPRSGASTLDGGTTPALASRPPVLGGFPAVVPRFAPSCVGADCGDPFTGVDPPGFWVVLQKNGPEFDVIPEFWAVVSVPRRDSRRWLRYNPRSEAFTSSMSRSAAYETAQDFARAFGRRALDEHRVTYDAAQNFARALLRDSLARPTRYARRRDVPPTSGTCTAIGCRCWRRGGSRCRWAHRRVARFRVRRRNPAGQAQGLRSRVALRR